MSYDKMAGLQDGWLTRMSNFFKKQIKSYEYLTKKRPHKVNAVPQGSVPALNLFLVYINDMASVCCGDSHLELLTDVRC